VRLVGELASLLPEDATPQWRDRITNIAFECAP
jgi:hypothetical protein